MLTNLSIELEEYPNNNIVDIIVYGSITRGKENPNDTDILILFREYDPDVYLELSKKYHVVGIKVDELFTLSSLLVEVLAEGWSVKYKRPLGEILGIRAFKEYIFKKVIYKGKASSKKTSLHYFLYGRKDRNVIGLLEETDSLVIRRNPFIIRVSIEKAEIFKTKLEAFAKTRGIEIELEEKTIIAGKTNLIKFD